MYLRSIAVLVIPAVIADVIIVIGISMVLVYDVIQIDTVSETIKGADPGGFPLFFGIAVFAFEGINMALPVEQSMTNPEEFKDVLQSVFIHLTVLLVLVGALSYSAYGNDTEDIIFLNLPQNWAVKTVQIFYAIALFFSIPVQMFPAIAILESFPYFGSVFRENIYIHRFLVMLVVGLIASVVPNFGLFVNLCGALGGATLAFCLPSVFYMRRSGTSWKPTFAIGFGIIGGITAMVVTIIQFAEGAGGD